MVFNKVKEGKMYKLLLVTDRDEVQSAFLKIQDWEKLMFHPITIIKSPEEAIAYLESHCVDAVGYSFAEHDSMALHLYLTENRPSLPVFQTHKHDNTLAAELKRIRIFLDNLHMDFSDGQFDESDILEILREELMHQILSFEITSKEELKSRLKLVRAQIEPDRPCFLFDFDLPQGEVYLQDRWHYGRERLESALRNNFFNRSIGNVFFGVAVITPRLIRVLASPRAGSKKESFESLSRSVEKHVMDTLQSIKDYLDLDLVYERYHVFEDIYAITTVNDH